MPWPANCLPLPEIEEARPEPTILTNVAPGSGDSAIDTVASRVKGALRQSTTRCVAAWAVDRRSRNTIPLLTRVYLVGHGSAGKLQMQGTDATAGPITLDVESYRPLLGMVRGSVLAPGAEIWLVGCLVGCFNRADRAGDGPLLLLSMARWLQCSVVAPTGYVSASVFDTVGPKEHLIPSVKVGPGDCPPRVEVPEVIDIPDDALADGAASFNELLRGARVLGDDFGASLLSTLSRAVEGARPYDGSLALDSPAESFQVVFGDGTRGLLEITLDGLAVAVRGSAWRLLYRKRRGEENLLTVLARPVGGLTDLSVRRSG